MLKTQSEFDNCTAVNSVSATQRVPETCSTSADTPQPKQGSRITVKKNGQYLGTLLG
jgi:hypothetical protein